MSNLLQSAPKNMLYNLQAVPAVEVKADLKRFDASITSGFTGSGQNEARIQISAADAFLDTNKSYLYFEVVGATAAFTIDGTAGAFIDRLEIQSNGRTIWRTDRYSLMHNLKKFYNSTLADANRLTACEGQRGLITQAAAAAYANHTINEVALSSIGEEIATGAKRNYCLELECGLLKNDLKKAIPQGANLEMVIRFRANNAAIVAHTGAPTWTINNVRFYTHAYQVLDAQATDFYNQMRAQGAVSWSGSYVKTYINNLPQASSTHTLQINDRSLSAKHMITVLRKTAADTTLANAKNSAFLLDDATGNVNSYEYMISGQPVPSSGRIEIEPAANGQNLGRCYEEAIKCLCDDGKATSDSMVSKSMFSSSSDTLDANKANATKFGKGVLAIDLRKMDDISLKMKGVNTASSAVPNNIRVEHEAFGSDIDATTFVVADATWTLQPNGEVSVVV